MIRKPESIPGNLESIPKKSVLMKRKLESIPEKSVLSAIKGFTNIPPKRITNIPPKGLIKPTPQYQASIENFQPEGDPGGNLKL